MRRRRRIVIGSSAAFLVVAAVAIPLQLVALSRTEAVARREVVLQPPGLDIAALPLVSFGPDGRAAAAHLSGASWVATTATSQCAAATGYAIRPRAVEVGFLTTVQGPRAVLAVYCTLPTGAVALEVAVVRGASHRSRIVLGVGRGVVSAELVATRATLTMRSGEVVRHGRLTRVAAETLLEF